MCTPCVPQEKHELEEQRLALVEEVQLYRKKIKQLEDDLLFRLSNSQVNMVTSLAGYVVLYEQRKWARICPRTVLSV
jgi:dynein heavy chain